MRTVIRSAYVLLLTLPALSATQVIGQDIDEFADTGSLSGRVVADGSFRAAKVYAYNPETRMTYMVYTHKGRYRAIHLFPGTYQVRIEHAGFSSEQRTVTVVAGKSAEANISMVAIPGEAIVVAGRDPSLLKVQPASYEEIYPPGPGRDIIERACIQCHGVHFIPGRALNRTAWNAMLDLMFSDEPAYGVPNGAPLIPPGTVSAAERAELLDYLTENFGPEKPLRAVTMDSPLQLDEQALSTAMWVEYRVAESNAENGAHRWIQEPYFDTHGNVWYTERTRGAGAILRLDPRTATFRRYPTPDPNWSPHGLIVDPFDGKDSVWWGGRNTHLARLDPATGETKAYLAPTGMHGHTPVFDSRQDVWFSMLTGNSIGKWSRSTDEIRLWEIPTPGGRPYGILVDQKDKVWFVEFHQCKIARFDPVTEEFDEYLAPSSPCTIRRLGLDSRGRIWYGAYSKGMLGVLDPRSDHINEYPIGRFSEPYDVWADPDDNIWASDGGQGGLLVKFDQKTEQITNYPSPMRSDMPKIAITRDGAVWYSNRSIAMTGAAPATVGVLYPDVGQIRTFGAYYAIQDGRPVGSGSPRPPVAE